MTHPRIHVSLNVRDLAASVQFYERLFGQTAVKRKHDYAKFMPSRPDVNLALNQSSDSVARGAGLSPVSHWGIEVASLDEVQQYKARLEAAGVEIALEEKDEVCCYALQDKIWVHDPDGNAWEVFHVQADAG